MPYPGTPKEQVEFLCKAFEQTIRDAEFKAKMEAKPPIDPVTVSEVEKSLPGFSSWTLAR